jgi:uncharacterized protein
MNNKPKQKFYFLWITAICILTYILQITITGFTKQFMLTEAALSKPWQFLTAVFLHGSTMHLAYNLFALIIFGLILEQVIGSKKFLAIYLISGILANIISFYWYPNALGASGAIMAVLGTLAILKPMMSVWAFGMIIPMFIAAILWAGGAVLGIFGFGDQGTGHLAHLSGLVIGLVYGIYLRFIKTRKSNKNLNNSYSHKIKLEIPEQYARQWENYYIKN